MITVQIEHYPGVSAELLDGIASDLANVAPSISILENKPGPQDSILLPALLAVFFVTPIWQGFGSQLGQDVYAAVKHVGLRALSALRDFPARWTTTSGQLATPPPLSISFQTDDHGVIRFIFPVGLDDGAVSQALLLLPDVIARALRELEGRGASYVYLEDDGNWVEITAQVLMSWGRKASR